MSNEIVNESVRRLIIRKVIIALFLDDRFFSRLALKGGNAIDIVYGLSGRASRDVDSSLRGRLDGQELVEFSDALARSFDKVFSDSPYEVFDFRFGEKPSSRSAGAPAFWGGYLAEFKIIERSRRIGSDLERKRREALKIGKNGAATFSVDFSHSEFIGDTTLAQLDDYDIQVYSPEMIVFEKLRAICQQLPAYEEVSGSQMRRPRARDFFDIHLLAQRQGEQLFSAEKIQILDSVFEAKQVPLEYLDQIADSREYHRNDFTSVTSTVPKAEELKSFDFYFDYALSLVSRIQEARNK